MRSQSKESEARTRKLELGRITRAAAENNTMSLVKRRREFVQTKIGYCVLECVLEFHVS